MQLDLFGYEESERRLTTASDPEGRFLVHAVDMYVSKEMAKREWQYIEESRPLRDLFFISTHYNVIDSVNVKNKERIKLGCIVGSKDYSCSHLEEVAEILREFYYEYMGGVRYLEGESFDPGDYEYVYVLRPLTQKEIITLDKILLP